MGLLDIVQNAMSNQDVITPIPNKISQQSYLRIKDTTPRAKELNNLNVNAPISVLNAVIQHAKKQGVDPIAALAESHKETLHGTKSPAPEINSVLNPMQYNGTDIGAKRFNSIVRDRLASVPEYIQAVQSVNNISSPQELQSVKADIQRYENKADQDTYINGGVNYLKQMLDKTGNLQDAFAKYRGAGQAAAYHGKHVMEIYNMLRKNPQILQLIDENN